MPSITEEHFHSHIQRRMEQRGIKEEEVRQTLREGWDTPDAKPGTEGRTLVFTYNAVWEERHYEEKEGIGYFKFEEEQLVLLTAIARYGQNFPVRTRHEGRIRSQTRPFVSLVEGAPSGARK